MVVSYLSVVPTAPVQASHVSILITMPMGMPGPPAYKSIGAANVNVDQVRAAVANETIRNFALVSVTVAPSSTT